MNRYLDEVKRLYRSEKYDDALRIIEEAEQQTLVSPALLVWKSRCLQLTNNPKGDLADAQASLEQALDLDDEYAPALIDLAYFHLNVSDDAETALPLLRKALSISKDSITECVIGLGQCISETDSPNAALAFLQRNAQLTIDSSKLEELKAELKRSVT
jgi:tetratricopeptide (TPR) repeat protein